MSQSLDRPLESPRHGRGGGGSGRSSSSSYGYSYNGHYSHMNARSGGRGGGGRGRGRGGRSGRGRGGGRGRGRGGRHINRYDDDGASVASRYSQGDNSTATNSRLFDNPAAAAPVSTTNSDTYARGTYGEMEDRSRREPVFTEDVVVRSQNENEIDKNVFNQVARRPSYDGGRGGRGGRGRYDGGRSAGRGRGRGRYSVFEHGRGRGRDGRGGRLYRGGGRNLHSDAGGRGRNSHLGNHNNDADGESQSHSNHQQGEAHVSSGSVDDAEEGEWRENDHPWSEAIDPHPPDAYRKRNDSYEEGAITEFDEDLPPPPPHLRQMEGAIKNRGIDYSHNEPRDARSDAGTDQFSRPVGSPGPDSSPRREPSGMNAPGPGREIPRRESWEDSRRNAAPAPTREFHREERWEDPNRNSLPLRDDFGRSNSFDNRNYNAEPHHGFADGADHRSKNFDQQRNDNNYYEGNNDRSSTFDNRRNSFDSRTNENTNFHDNRRPGGFSSMADPIIQQLLPPQPRREDDAGWRGTDRRSNAEWRPSPPRDNYGPSHADDDWTRNNAGRNVREPTSSYSEMGGRESIMRDTGGSDRNEKMWNERERFAENRAGGDWNHNHREDSQAKYAEPRGNWNHPDSHDSPAIETNHHDQSGHNENNNESRSTWRERESWKVQSSPYANNDRQINQDRKSWNNRENLEGDDEDSSKWSKSRDFRELPQDVPSSDLHYGPASAVIDRQSFTGPSMGRGGRGRDFGSEGRGGRSAARGFEGRGGRIPYGGRDSGRGGRISFEGRGRGRFDGSAGRGRFHDRGRGRGGRNSYAPPVTRHDEGAMKRKRDFDESFASQQQHDLLLRKSSFEQHQEEKRLRQEEESRATPPAPNLSLPPPPVPTPQTWRSGGADGRGQMSPRPSFRPPSREFDQAPPPALPGIPSPSQFRKQEEVSTCTISQTVQRDDSDDKFRHRPLDALSREHGNDFAKGISNSFSARESSDEFQQGPGPPPPAAAPFPQRESSSDFRLPPPPFQREPSNTDYQQQGQPPPVIRNEHESDFNQGPSPNFQRDYNNDVQQKRPPSQFGGHVGGRGDRYGGRGFGRGGRGRGHFYEGRGSFDVGRSGFDGGRGFDGDRGRGGKHYGPEGGGRGGFQGHDFRVPPPGMSLVPPPLTDWPPPEGPPPTMPSGVPPPDLQMNRPPAMAAPLLTTGAFLEEAPAAPEKPAEAAAEPSSRPPLLPSHPPPLTPPDPGPPSGFCVALARLVDAESQLDYAYAKHRLLVRKHELLRKERETLEKLPVGREAFQEDLDKLIADLEKSAQGKASAAS